MRDLRVILFLLLLLPLTGKQSLHAQSSIENHISHLELEQAGRMTLAEQDVKLRTYYQVRILFLKYLATEDPDLLPRFLNLSRTALQLLERLPDADADKMVMQAEVFFLRGAVKLLDKRMLGGAVDMKSACNLIERNSRRFPDNVEQQKLLGIFQVAISAIPKKLQWLGNALCFKGDLQAGLQQLEQAAQHSRLLPSEADIILFYFEKNLLDRPEAANARIRKRHAAAPKSVINNYLLLSSYLELRQNDAALALAEAMEPVMQQNTEAEVLPHWHYARAKAHFFKLEYDQAILHFDIFLRAYKGRTLYADALYRKGMSLMLSGRYPDAQRIFHDLTKVESSSFDVDEYAAKMAAIYLASEPDPVDKDLYAARNLFDGGYYHRSLALLGPIAARSASCSENQRTELSYRMGRNWQALDSLARATDHYHDCIAGAPGRNLWMKVYAHYYLGRIAETRGDTEAAKQWYKDALSYDDYAYQSGLEQRCKTALHQLRQAKNRGPQ